MPRRTDERMEPTAITMTKSMVKRLDALATVSASTRSAVVRAMLTEGLRRAAEQNTQRSTP